MNPPSDNLAAVPIIVHKFLPKGTIILVQQDGSVLSIKGTFQCAPAMEPRPAIWVDSLDTLEDAMDADFYAKAGIAQVSREEWKKLLTGDGNATKTS